MKAFLVPFLALALAGTSPAVTIAASDPLNVAGLGAGSTFQLMFTSSTLLQRDLLDGVDDGSDNSTIGQWNAWVNSVADGSSITGASGLTWYAMVSVDNLSDESPGVAARDNAVVSSTVYLMDGQFVASGFTDMWDAAIGSAPDVDESGNTIAMTNSTNREIWTGDASGYSSAGVIGASPLGNGANVAQTGDASQSRFDSAGGTGWFSFGAHIRRDANQSRRVYALSEPITIAAIPEPRAALLGGLGLLALLRRRR